MDVTAIFNLALNAIGARSNVASPTENSREAQVCSLWYPVVKGQVLAAAPWPELTRFASLVVQNERDLEEDWVATNARPGYTFAYALPDDCVRPQYLTNFDRFLLQAYEDTWVLSTNTENAILAYTHDATISNLWSPSLQMALAYALAANICQPLSGKTSRSKSLADQANMLIMQARENAANMSNEVFEHTPDWIVARGYSGSLASSQYIYPTSSLLVVANVS